MKDLFVKNLSLLKNEQIKVLNKIQEIFIKILNFYRIISIFGILR